MFLPITSDLMFVNRNAAMRDYLSFEVDAATNGKEFSQAMIKGNFKLKVNPLRNCRKRSKKDK